MSISDEASIGHGNRFGPGVVIEAGVVIGDMNVVGAHTVVLAGTRIGSGNRIGPHCAFGFPSRQRFREHPGVVELYDGPRIEIGDENLVFESVTVHLPVRETTRIGWGNSIGAHSHIGHDVEVAKQVITAGGCMFGGYVTVQERANFGLGVVVHPRVVVGPYAMVGVGSGVIRHVLPAATVGGVPARFLKPNERALSRFGVSEEAKAGLMEVLSGTTSPSESRSPEVRRLYDEFLMATARWGRLGFEPPVRLARSAP